MFRCQIWSLLLYFSFKWASNDEVVSFVLDIFLLLLGWFCCYWNKQNKPGHYCKWSLKEEERPPRPCSPSRCRLSKDGGLREKKTTLSKSIYDIKEYFSIHLPWQSLCGVVVDLQLQKNTLNLDKPSIIFWSCWVVFCPIVLSWVTHDQGNHVCVVKVEIVGSLVLFGGIYFVFSSLGSLI